MSQIIERAAWNARHGRGSLDPGAEPRVVIHHSYRPALGPDATPEEERAAVRGIEKYHVENNGWAGIGYNFLVAPSGRVYEGRGWKYRGSHAGPVNGESIGICLLIDGSVTPPNEATVRAVRELIRLGLELGEIAPGYTVSGHRDHMDRTCPGDRVYAALATFRHDAGPAPAAGDRLDRVRWPEPEVVPARTPPPAADDRPVLDPIVVPSREDVERAAAATGVEAAALSHAAPALEAVLGAVAAGSGGDRAALAGELLGALRLFREAHGS